MSSLEQRIATWHARLAGNPIYRTEDLDELEGHLRESVSALVQKGLSEEEAFWVAAHRLGEAEALGEEYGKVSTSARWRTRLLWVLGGYLTVATVRGLSTTISYSLYLFGTWFVSRPYGFLAPVRYDYLVPLNVLFQILLMGSAVCLLLPGAVRARARLKQWCWGSNTRRALTMSVTLFMASPFSIYLCRWIYSMLEVIPDGRMSPSFSTSTFLLAFGWEMFFWVAFFILLLWKRLSVRRSVPAF